MKSFTIYDVKAEAFAMPFFQKTIGLADRCFRVACSDPESQLNHHPEDFTLFYVGEFDERNGRFTQPKAPQPIVSALEALGEKTGLYADLSEKIAEPEAAIATNGVADLQMDMEDLTNG